MSSQVPSSAATNPTLHVSARPPVLVPATTRVANAAAAQAIVSLKARAKLAEDRTDSLESTVQELQGRDEQSQEKITELTLRLNVVEAQFNQLRAQLSVVLKSVGLDIDGPSTIAIPTAGNIIAPVHAGPVPVGPVTAAGSVKVEPATATDSSLLI